MQETKDKYVRIASSQALSRRFLRYQLPKSSKLIEYISLEDDNYKKTELIIKIWDEMEELADKSSFLKEKFKEINEIFLVGLFSTIIKEVETGVKEPIDIRFSDYDKLFKGFKSANLILGNIEKNNSTLDPEVKMEMLGLALLKIKETQFQEIISLLNRYKKDTNLDDSFLCPKAIVDGTNIISIDDYQKGNKINIRRLRNGIAHSNLSFEDRVIEITDISPKNINDKYIIKMSHEMFSGLIENFYLEIGLICALNDLSIIVIENGIKYGIFLEKLLRHLRRKGYRVPKPDWDFDELQ